MASKLEDIRPRRVSLVKRGANLRRILLAKGDEENLDGFVTTLLAEPVEKEDELLAAVEKAQGDESVAKAVSTLVRAADGLREPFGDEFRDAIVKAAKQQMLDEDADDDSSDDDGDNDGDWDDDDIAKAREEIWKAESPVYKRDFTAAQRRDLAAKGHALPDGSYPIETKADIGPALTLAQSGHGDTAAAKALIKRRAKALGAEDQLPDDWNVNKEDSAMSETAQAVPVKKEDGSWDLSAVPEENREAVEKALEAVAKAHDDELAELRKENEEQKTQAAEAIEIAKAERDQRERREYIEKAASLDNLSKSDEEIGDLLLSIAKAERDEHLPEGTSEKLSELLKAANEAAAGVFKEAGRVGHGEQRDAQGKLDAAAEDLRKADPNLTREQAVAKALADNPDLYTEIRKES